MSQKFLILFVILLLVSCQHETVPPHAAELDDIVESRSPRERIKVCHYDEETNTWRVMHIPVNAWPAHEAHGDILGDCPEEEESADICDQVWMTTNLDLTTYKNGDPIPQVTDPNEWAALTTGAWCYFNNDPAHGEIYGKLYNWYAVTDPRGLAPAGWHIPSLEEWTTLIDCLGGSQIAGGKAKTTGTIEDGTGLWRAPNVDATNESNFSGLPGGIRNHDTGEFVSFTFAGVWWSTTVDDDNPDNVWYSLLSFEFADFHRNHFPKGTGFSVRCVKD
jgi:uncharacterized protein (TIGR02145 family)